MDIVSQFLHLIAFVIGCYLLTWLTRRVVETAKPQYRVMKGEQVGDYQTPFARWWNEFILYLLSPLFGMILGYFLHPHLTWPKGFDSVQSVVFFGLVCGWLSGLLYKFFVKLLLKRAGATESQAARAVSSHERDPKIPG